MESENPLYNIYYDKIFSNKNYQKEVSIILSLFQKITKKRPEKVLDIGCGTGSHSMFFANESKYVLGIDADKKAIKIANKKKTALKKQNVQFDSVSLKKISENNFDLAVSLFNVVNYIDSAKKLENFFKGINDNLKNKGIFIFDCWNGIAALRDEPKTIKKVLKFDNETIEIESIPKTNLLAQKVLMQNKVKIKVPKQTDINFSFRYTSTLWTPKNLKEILVSSGFNDILISTWQSPNKPANYKDWKILFICQKRK